MDIGLRRRLTALLITLASVVTAPCFLALPARAETAEEIDAHVNAALRRFKQQIKGAPQLLDKAEGILIVPEVKKLGLVVGGQWGEGALFVRGQPRPAGYYRMDAGSVGLQAGYEKADFVFLFLTRDALAKFRSQDSWTAGADAGVTLVDESFAGTADTLKSRAPVAAFVFGEKGLMGGVSVKGTKFTRSEPDD